MAHSMAAEHGRNYDWGTHLGWFTGRRIDRWDVLAMLSLIIPALSLLAPEIDDSFAVVGTLFIVLTNSYMHSGKRSEDEATGVIPGTPYEKALIETGNRLMNMYLDQLRTGLASDGYTPEQVEGAIGNRLETVKKSVRNAITTGIRSTAIRKMKDNISPSGSYFTSPYTGKKYAFVFGSAEELLLNFISDDYSSILQESVPGILDLLRVRNAG